MPEPKCQIYWSKDGSSNLANLPWSDLPQEETEITVSSFSCDSNGIKKINEEQKEINKALIALQDFRDKDIKVFLNEHRQLLSRIEPLPED